MEIIDEIIYDFELRRSRVLLSGNLAIVDNVKKLISVCDTSIIVSNGKEFTSVSGEKLFIKELMGERMRIAGNIEKVEIFVKSN